MNGSKINLKEELRLVPWWAWMLAAAVFVGAQWGFNVWIPTQQNPPPPAVRALLGLLTGTVMGAYFLLLGYVNADSKRRGMNRALWTLLVIFIPNAIGFILYFFLRHPIVGSCPACGASVQSGFNYCPRCNHKLVATCGVCQHALRPGDTFCPYCGAKLDAAARASTPPAPAPH
jgi:hypothetical protein